MPPRGRPPQERAMEVLAQIEAQGGIETLPTVLGSQEVRPLMGRTWFGDALRLGALPGVQFERGGTWRCERETFFAWLREVADGRTATMAFGPSSVAEPRTSGTDASGHTHDDAEVGAAMGTSGDSAGDSEPQRDLDFGADALGGAAPAAPADRSAKP